MELYYQTIFVHIKPYGNRKPFLSKIILNNSILFKNISSLNYKNIKIVEIDIRVIS